MLVVSDFNGIRLCSAKLMIVSGMVLGGACYGDCNGVGE